MINNFYTLVDLTNSVSYLNDSILELLLILFMTIIFILFFNRIFNKIFGSTKRTPIIYKIIYLLVYVLVIMLLTKENFIFWLIILFLIYIIVYKMIKRPKINIQNIIGKDYFDFKEVNVDDKDIIKKTFEIYKIVSYSWSNLDMFPAKMYLSDKLYSIYENQLNSLFLKEQRNVMNDIELVKGKVKSIVEYKESDVIIVILEVRCKDYLINSVDNKVLKGHPSFIMDYVYELTFNRKKELKRNNVCPKCNAILPINYKKNKCLYCNSKVKTYSYKYILCKKNLLKQTAKKI